MHTYLNIKRTCGIKLRKAITHYTFILDNTAYQLTQADPLQQG